MFEVKEAGETYSKSFIPEDKFSKFVIVYGTLKEGYGNNPVLGNSTLISDVEVPGYKLFDSGFPVAMPDPNSTISGEIWEVISPQVMKNLDRLEGNGTMYNRTPVSIYGIDCEMYVGHPKFWDHRKLQECPKDATGTYYWGD